MVMACLKSDVKVFNINICDFCTRTSIIMTVEFELAYVLI